MIMKSTAIAWLWVGLLGAGAALAQAPAPYAVTPELVAAATKEGQVIRFGPNCSNG